MDTPLTPVEPRRAGHARWVRACHWLLAASVLAAAYSGFVVLMAHPRLYWGEAGNDLTPALLELPISRNYKHGGWQQNVAFAEGPGAAVSASRTYEIFNEDGWARSLHFLAAWFLVATGAVFCLAGFLTGHVGRDLVPRARELAPRALWRDFTERVRKRAVVAPGPPYGELQKCAYFGVVFFALPLMVVTGLAMSPAITAAYPFVASVWGGAQSARTIHFSGFAALVLFTAGHVLMAVRSGLGRQIRALTWGG